MKKFIKSLLGENSTISSKRFIAVTGFMFLGVTMLVNSFFEEHLTPAESLVSAVQYITIIAIGGVASEKFVSRAKNN